MQTLVDRLRGVADVVVSPSMFADKDAFWVNGKEIAHLHDEALDLRLTRAQISAHRADLRADPRITLRGSSSDWLEVSVRTGSDIDFAHSLFQLAVEAHRPPPGTSPRAPPRGAELERRRRFH